MGEEVERDCLFVVKEFKVTIELFKTVCQGRLEIVYK